MADVADWMTKLHSTGSKSVWCRCSKTTAAVSRWRKDPEHSSSSNSISSNDNNNSIRSQPVCLRPTARLHPLRSSWPWSGARTAWSRVWRRASPQWRLSGALGRRSAPPGATPVWSDLAYPARLAGSRSFRSSDTHAVVRAGTVSRTGRCGVGRRVRRAPIQKEWPDSSTCLPDSDIACSRSAATNRHSPGISRPLRDLNASFLCTVERNPGEDIFKLWSMCV